MPLINSEQEELFQLLSRSQRNEEEQELFELFQKERGIPRNRLTPDTIKEIQTLSGNPQQKETVNVFGRSFEGEKGFGDRIFNVVTRSYEKGTIETEKNLLLGGVVLGDNSPETAARITELEKQGIGDIPIEGNTEYIANAIAEQIPQILRMFANVGQKGAAGTAGGAVMGFLLGGPGGAAVGAAAGATIGTFVGMAEHAFKLEAGSAFDEYSKFKDDEGNLLDPRAAKIGAIMAGAINAGYEAIPFGIIFAMLPGSKRILQKAGIKTFEALAFPKTTAAMKTFLFNIAKLMAVEGGQEIGQEDVTIKVGEVLKEFSGRDFEPITTEEYWSRIKESGIKGAIVGTALGGLPAGTRLISDIATREGVVTDEQKLQRAAKEIQEEEAVKPEEVTPETIIETAREVEKVVTEVTKEEKAVPEAETIAQVEETLKKIAPSKEARDIIIKGRIDKLDTDIANLDIQIGSTEKQVVLRKLDNKPIKALENKIDKLIEEREVLDESRANLITAEEQIVAASKLEALTEKDIVGLEAQKETIQIKGEKIVKLEEQSLKTQERALLKGLREGKRFTKETIVQGIKDLKKLIDSTSLPKKSRDSLKAKLGAQGFNFSNDLAKLKSSVGLLFDKARAAIVKETERVAVKKQKDRIETLLKSKNIKPKVVRGVRKGKFTADIQQRLEELRALKKTSGKKTKTGLTQDEIDLEALEQFGNLANLFKKTGEIDPIEGISPAQKLLDERLKEQQIDGVFDPLGNAVLNIKANPNEANGVELEKIADEIEDLITEGKNAAKERVNARNLRNETLAFFAADTIRTVEEQLLIDSTTLGRRIVDIGKKIQNLRRYSAENWQGYVDIAFNLKGVDNSDIIKALDVRREFSEAVRLQNEFGNKYRDIIKRAIGTTSDFVYNKQLMKDHKRQNIGKQLIKEGKRDASLGDKFINSKGQKVVMTLSKAEIRNYWLEHQDKTSHETFFHDDGNAFTPEMMEEIFSVLEEHDFAITEARLTMLEELLPKHDAVYSKMNGVHLDSKVDRDGRYWPWSRTTGARDVLGFEDDQAMRATMAISSQKIRTKNRFKFKPVSDEAVMQRHLFEVSHYIATADKLTDVRQIISDTKLKDAIDSKFGKGLHRMMAEVTTDFIRGRVDKGKGLDKLVNEMNSRFAASVLRLKPIIGVKQLLSIPAYLERMPVNSFIAGELDFLSHPRKAIKILNQVPNIVNRPASPEVAIANIAQDIDNIKLSLKRGTRWSKLLDANIRMGDIGAIYAGGWALYKYKMKQGLSHQQALNIVEDATLDRQQSQALNQLSALQRGHSLGRSLMAFSSAPVSYLRAEFQAIRQGTRRKITPYQAGRQFAIYHFLLPMIWQFVADGFEVEEKHLIRAAILGNFNTLGIVGDLIVAIYNELISEKAFDIEALPFVAALNDIYRGIGDIADSALEIDSQEFYDGVKRLASTTGKLTRQPVQQFFNIYEGVRDISEEGIGKEPVLQVAGQPQTKN